MTDVLKRVGQARSDPSRAGHGACRQIVLLVARWHDWLVAADGTGEFAVSRQVSVRAAAMRRDRNNFRVHPAPTEWMSKSKKRPVGTGDRAPDDLRELVAFFEGMDEGRERFRWTLRDSLDELLDGQRTGRWCYQHLMKTEKTYLGTAIEINLSREFDIEDGLHLDWSVAGVELDCKFSRDIAGWEIPMEMYVCSDHGTQSGIDDFPALLVWMSDDTNEWAAGLLRISDERLRWKKGSQGEAVRLYNRDNKRKIDPAAEGDIYWLWGGVQNDLPPNLLLNLVAEVRERILKPASSGQRRINDLFRYVQDRLIDRAVVLTVGQQDDAPKRVRDARNRLRREGIIVLGHETSHRRIARSLDLSEPAKGSWISTKVTPASIDEDAPGFFLDDRWWKKATEGDLLAPGPAFPKAWNRLKTRP